MMKKEMILPSSSVRSGQYAASRPPVFAALKGYCLRSKAVHSLSAFYSRLLELASPLADACIFFMHTGFVLDGFPIPFSPLFRFCSWDGLPLTVAQCRRAGLK